MTELSYRRIISAGILLSCNRSAPSRMTRVDCQLWRFDSAATETPALHVEPGQLNAICVEHTTQMTLFRCAVGHPCGHARSIINSIIGMYWVGLPCATNRRPADLEFSSTAAARRVMPSLSSGRHRLVLQALDRAAEVIGGWAPRALLIRPMTALSDR